LANKSILAVFPTGGGKSITFQVPALISGETSKGLTIVISPLQSLMKDQVDNLEKLGITDAVTINGLLDPIERAKSFERIEEGSASILYISPESLRSKTIEHLLLGRKIVRFVIDEAHCFSSWGQDFRVDYLYIGEFIKLIQEKKNLDEAIPVSCFTATAKQKVIEDISEYFREKLSLDLELFTSKVSRTNLQYKVYEKGDEEEKYQQVRDLIEEKNVQRLSMFLEQEKPFYWQKDYPKMVLMQNLIMGNWISRKI
jgi:ATP-dependent DNA helicase RecQ